MPPTSQSQKDAMGRYYDKNRDKLLVDMRNRDHNRRATERIRLDENPDDKKVALQMNSDKYYKTIENKQRKLINELLADNGICPTFKAFLQSNVLPSLPNGLPMKFLELCRSHLYIVRANSPELNPNPITIDGAN